MSMNNLSESYGKTEKTGGEEQRHTVKRERQGHLQGKTASVPDRQGCRSLANAERTPNMVHYAQLVQD